MMRFDMVGYLGAYMILAMSAVASAQSPAPASGTAGAEATPAVAAPGPSLETALTAALAAIKSCKYIDQNVSVSVVDSAGIQKVMLSADGATPRSVQSSGNKARTALAFQTATSELGERSKSDPALADRVAADPNYNSRAGGVLIVKKGRIVGAIGVGGAKGSEKDEGCATVALSKIK